jgi:hypothetical protein
MTEITRNSMVTVLYDGDKSESGAVVTHVHKGRHHARALHDNIVAVVDVFAFPRGEGQGRAFTDVPVFAGRDQALERNDDDYDGNPRDIAVAAYAGDTTPKRDEATHAIDAKQPGQSNPAPAGNASTEDWRRHAVEVGAVSEDDARDLNREELRAKVAERKA